MRQEAAGVRQGKRHARQARRGESRQSKANQGRAGQDRARQGRAAVCIRLGIQTKKNLTKMEGQGRDIQVPGPSDSSLEPGVPASRSS
jgi:hypothetical protein